MDQREALFELPVKKAIIKFVTPCVLSQIVSMIYNLADTFFVGRTGDPNQVAGLSLCFPIYMILTAVANLFGIGANSNISRLIGKKESEKAKNVSAFSFWTAISVSVVISVILATFAKPLLTAAGASKDTYQYAYGYAFWVIIVGGIPVIGSMVAANLLRSEGMTKAASTGLMLGGILNIVLDPILISVFKMGAEGAGLATFISHIVSLGYLLYNLYKRKGSTVISVNPRHYRVPRKTAQDILLVGLPAFLVVILGCTANFILNHFMTAYGDVNMAAFGIVQKVGNLTVQIAVGITTGVMPLIGYHFAARHGARVREISKISYILLACFTAVCVALYEVLAKYIINAFINDEETIKIGAQFLRRWILCAPGMCFTQLFNAQFQAMGMWKHSTALSFIRQGIVLIPMLIILNHTIGMYGLVIAAPIADTVSLILGFVLYFTVARKKLNT